MGTAALSVCPSHSRCSQPLPRCHTLRAAADGNLDLDLDEVRKDFAALCNGGTHLAYEVRRMRHATCHNAQHASEQDTTVGCAPDRHCATEVYSAQSLSGRRGVNCGGRSPKAEAVADNLHTDNTTDRKRAVCNRHDTTCNGHRRMQRAASQDCANY